MTSEQDADSYYCVSCDRDDKAEALRQRQLQSQQNLMRLQRRTDYVVQPGVIGTQGQSLRKIPMGDVQRLPVGEQIVRDPALLKRVIMPTPMPSVKKPVAVSSEPYVPRVDNPPLKKTPSILYSMGLSTGVPVKKWPTSFKKATHKQTVDESIMKGLNNLDRMSKRLLGR